MRVLHVIPSVAAADGGPSEALVLMETALAAAGVAVTTLASDGDGPGGGQEWEARPPGSNVRRVYCWRWLNAYKVAPAMIPWLWRNLRGFDVVHIHALFSFASVAAALLARWLAVPYVVRPLGTLSPYGLTRRRPWLKRLSLALLEEPILRRAAAVHFTTEAEQAEAAALGLPMRGVVIPLGVESATDAATPLLAAYPQLRGRPVVLFLSRVDPKKNVEALLEAFVLPEMRGRDAMLLVAGNGALCLCRATQGER